MILCEHLQSLEADLLSAGIKEIFRGQAWSANCREWVYFDCVLNTQTLRRRYYLPDFVIHSQNDDRKSGLEAGLVCTVCKDAIMGIHISLSKGKVTFD